MIGGDSRRVGDVRVCNNEEGQGLGASPDQVTCHCNLTTNTAAYTSTMSEGSQSEKPVGVLYDLGTH